MLRKYLPTLAILILGACNGSGRNGAHHEAADSLLVADTMANKENGPPDVLAVAPGFYKVLDDTLGIRILETNYAPGDSSVLHHHPDHVVYVVDGGKTELIAADGTRQEMEIKTGTVLVLPGGSHRVKNTGNTNIKAVLVEVNRPRENFAQDTTTDITKTIGDHYKILRDTMGLRILEVSYRPGQSSAFHTHPDAAIYTLQGSTMELTSRNGEKERTTANVGAAGIRPMAAHSAKNIGKTTLKLVMVEVNRSR